MDERVSKESFLVACMTAIKEAIETEIEVPSGDMDTEM